MTNPFLDLLRHRSFPDLAAALRSAAPALIRQWADVIRQALPTADEMTFTQLRDDLPEILERMAHALESERPGPTDALVDITPAHGAVRFHQSYKLDELIFEYHVLRGLAAQLLASRMGRTLSTDEQVAFNSAIDVAVRHSTVEFVEHQTSQLRKATEAQSKYLSFLSHDLRGELNGVFLMIEVLRRELAHEERFAESLEDLDLMRRSIHQTIATMDRFLHAERFRKGKVQVKPAEVNLASVLNEVGAQIAYQAKDKGLELKIDVPGACRTFTDKELVMMILQNLASNAVKYTPKGEVRLAVSTGSGEVDGWRVTVTDQGPGIPPEQLSELFDSFTRGDTHGQPGVGLGLSIANQAAQLLGARLWAESTPGAGASFHLQLPKAPPARPADKAP